MRRLRLAKLHKRLLINKRDQCSCRKRNYGSTVLTDNAARISLQTSFHSTVSFALKYMIGLLHDTTYNCSAETISLAGLTGTKVVYDFRGKVVK